MVVATLTFGSGLSTLVSHPALYGWNWNYAMSSNYLIPPQVIARLHHDPDVVASSSVSFANAQINGQTVPILLTSNNAQVAPPMLSGHPVETKDEIVLGAATLAQLHEHVGGTVLASYGTAKDYPVYVPPTRLLIVGHRDVAGRRKCTDASHFDGHRCGDLHQHRTSGVHEVPHQP